jgi:hypothetical protein
LGVEAYNGRVGDGPLRGTANAVVQLALIGVVATVCVGQEEGVDTASLEELGELYPVLQLALCG